MEATINWNLTNQQIPETLSDAGVALRWSPYMTSNNKHHGGRHVVLIFIKKINYV